LQKLGAPESKCTVIYSEAPVRVSQPAKTAISGIKKKKNFAVLYIGQLSQHKGLDVLIRAAMRMCRIRDDVEFLIAGDYEWKNAFATTLKDDVHEAGLAGRIRFLGYVDAIHDLFKVADLHVLPSIWEDPLPNVVMEAKNAGLPSVVFPSGGVPEIVEHEREGYVCNDRTEESLIAGIEYYADHPERASSHGRNAHASLERLGTTRYDQLWEGIFAKA